MNKAGVSGVTHPNIPPNNNQKSAKNYDNILTCVEQLAKLYINNVGTYKKIFRTSTNDIDKHDCTNKAYEYLKVMV